jgi:hypothetical protein
MKRSKETTVVDLLLDGDWTYNDARFFQQFLQSCFPGKEDEIRAALANDDAGLRIELKKAFCTDSVDVELQHTVLKRFVLLINDSDVQPVDAVLFKPPSPFQEPNWLQQGGDLLADPNQVACACSVR